MKHFIWAIGLFLFCFSGLKVFAETTTKTCAIGKDTKLVQTETARIPQHDQSLGQSGFELLNQKDQKSIFKIELSESWSCEGFNAEKSIYILSGRWEKGTVLATNGIRLLPEGSRHLVVSKFEKKNRSAVTTKWSRNFRFMAFIDIFGTIGVYDIYTDSIHDFGKAPAPPFLSSEDKAALDEMKMDWSWTTFAEQNRGTIEPWLFNFKDTETLEASYGKDTTEKRAKKRKVKSWSLKKIFRK